MHDPVALMSVIEPELLQQVEHYHVDVPTPYSGEHHASKRTTNLPLLFGQSSAGITLSFYHQFWSIF